VIQPITLLIKRQRQPPSLPEDVNAIMLGRSGLTTAGHQAVQGVADGVTLGSGRAIPATSQMTSQMAARANSLRGPPQAAGYNATATVILARTCG